MRKFLTCGSSNGDLGRVQPSCTKSRVWIFLDIQALGCWWMRWNLKRLEYADTNASTCLSRIGSLLLISTILFLPYYLRTVILVWTCEYYSCGKRSSLKMILHIIVELNFDVKDHWGVRAHNWCSSLLSYRTYQSSVCKMDDCQFLRISMDSLDCLIQVTDGNVRLFTSLQGSKAW